MNFNEISHFDSEEEFESTFIELLKECGWEKNVLKYPTEEDLIKNWADILFSITGTKTSSAIIR